MKLQPNYKYWFWKHYLFVRIIIVYLFIENWIMILFLLQIANQNQTHQMYNVNENKYYSDFFKA